METMSNLSLSKKWRLAVKENLFDGSFKEFVALHNESFDVKDEDKAEEHFSDDAAKDLTNKAVTDTTAIDLKPIDKTKLEEPKIMGLNKNTFILVAGGLTVVSILGIYLLTSKLSKGDK